MRKLKNIIRLLLTIFIFCSSQATAQVPASQEPFHRIVFQNKYIRILDVLLQPGDTTQFHIHSIPSLFIYLSNTTTALQTRGKDWVQQRSVLGKARYSSYSPDILIHRVTNMDSVPFHVNDIEILSSFDTSNLTRNKPLHFPVLFENEKSFAYQLGNGEIKGEVTKSRGPMIAELIEGDKVFINYPTTNQSKEIKASQFLYIEPGTLFYFTTTGASQINMILFEIK